jgi:hypothetical protein
MKIVKKKKKKRKYSMPVSFGKVGTLRDKRISAVFLEINSVIGTIA